MSDFSLTGQREAYLDLNRGLDALNEEVSTIFDVMSAQIKVSPLPEIDMKNMRNGLDDKDVKVFERLLKNQIGHMRRNNYPRYQEALREIKNALDDLKKADTVYENKSGGILGTGLRAGFSEEDLDKVYRHVYRAEQHLDAIYGD